MFIQKRSNKVAYKLLVGQKIKNESFAPSKTFLPADLPDSVKLPRVEPEVMGVSKDYIRAFFDEIVAHPEVFVHGVVVVKDGRVIGETYKEPYRADVPHTSFSMCKTVVGMAIGILIDKKIISLSDKVSDLIDLQKYSAVPNAKTKELTVEELLTMKSGVAYREEGVIGESNWVKNYFSAKVKNKEKFGYNSMNSFILGLVVKEQTGKSLTEFIKEHIFNYLGIKKFYWEKNEQGLEKGGWGLYITTEDMAKIGTLILNGGTYYGRRIISSEWINLMTASQSKVPDHIGDHDYGYHIWTKKGDDISYSLNGLFGQSVSIFKKKGIVVAINSGNNDLFFANPVFSILHKYFITGDTPSSGMKYLMTNKPINIDSFLGKYDLSTNKKGFSLLPVVMQVMTNNFSSGISQMSLIDEQNHIKMSLLEDQAQELIFDKTGKYLYQSVQNRGDKYLIATKVKQESEDSVSFYAFFIETPSVRKINFSYINGELYLTFYENPSIEIVNGAVKIVEKARKNKAYESVIKLAKPIVNKLAKNVFVVTKKIKKSE